MGIVFYYYFLYLANVILGIVFYLIFIVLAGTILGIEFYKLFFIAAGAILSIVFLKLFLYCSWHHLRHRISSDVPTAQYVLIPRNLRKRCMAMVGFQSSSKTFQQSKDQSMTSSTASKLKQCFVDHAE